ncbi:MAG: hypothetical protein PHG06_18880 [Parabacteroides sp.]|nr:hypothetical protein [Parabacteroides sp.]
MEEIEKKETEQEESVTMTKADYDKSIQSAEDKLRTKYSKQIKELEDKITELTPKEKSENELALEKRLAEVESKEKRLNLIDTLVSKNLDKGIADYLKDDADVESFEKLISSMVNKRIEKSGYKPTNHQNSDGISKETWKKMSYSEKTEFYNKNPELAKKFMANK